VKKSHNSKSADRTSSSHVGPRWVQVNAEFPIKNHQTRINLYSKKLIIRNIVLCPRVQYKSYSRRALRALARPAYSRLRCSSPVFPPLPCGKSGKKKDGNLLGRSAWASDPPKLRLGPCPPLLGRMFRIHSAPSRNNKYKMRRLTVVSTQK
jgi:hypothetical protein